MNSSNKTVLAIHCFFKLAPVFHSLIVFFLNESGAKMVLYKSNQNLSLCHTELTIEGWKLKHISAPTYSSIMICIMTRTA